MGNSAEHAESSVKIFGGSVEDYLSIHEFLDSSQEAFDDVRHQALTHNRWFIANILVEVFGHTITNSDGKRVLVERIAEHHIEEDFPESGIIPSVSDWLGEMKLQPWMNTNGVSSSNQVNLETQMALDLV